MEEISAKKIIQPHGNFNLYRGCMYHCIYCDSRSVVYQNHDFDRVKLKKDALKLIEQTLISRRKKQVLTTGAMSDPYPPQEQQTKMMRETLKLIKKYHFGISVLTKSSSIERDFDIYKTIHQHQPAIIQLTITTTDDALANIIEPQASLPSARLKTLKKASDEGLITGIWMTPILPFINDTEENIVAIVKAAKTHGVTFIRQFGIGTTMREGSREYFYKQLDQQFKGLKHRYQKTYQDKYICLSLKHKKLLKVFKETCEAEGILYKDEDINALFKTKRPVQQSLF